MTKKIGIIAEETSDVETVEEIIKKVIPETRISIRSFVGNGCGKIRGKSSSWAQILWSNGCKYLIILHDKDNYDVNDLFESINKELRTCPISKNVIIIPVMEIEAWLLSDSNAIIRAMNLSQNFAQIPNPQSIPDPKRKLGEIIYLRSGRTKRYINTKHNKKIAAEVDITNLRRCSSFLPLESFLLEQIN